MRGWTTSRRSGHLFWGTPSDGKDCYREGIAAVRAKREQLPQEGHDCRALSTEIPDGVSQYIEGKLKEDLLYDYWPPVFRLVASRSVATLLQLEADIELALSANGTKSRKTLTSFRQGVCYGGLIDL